MSAATFTITPPRELPDGPGYAVSVALGEVLSWALENGMGEDELEERFEEELERVQGL